MMSSENTLDTQEIERLQQIVCNTQQVCTVSYTC